MNAPVWALLLLSPVVPLLDRLFPASRFTWPSSQASPQGVLAVPAPAVRRVAPLLVLPLLVLLHPAPALAFCGFYVGKADDAAVQRLLAGGAGAGREPHRPHDEQRLPRPAHG